MAIVRINAGNDPYLYIENLRHAIQERNSPPRSSHILGLVQAIRERDSTNPKDRAFAFHGVLRRLKCQISTPNYSESVGAILESFFGDLLSWEPVLIALLIDAGEPPQGALSWVPDWSITRTEKWDSPSLVYEFIKKKPWARNEIEFEISGSTLALAGTFLGAVARRPSILPSVEVSNWKRLGRNDDYTILSIVDIMLEWLANARRDVRVPVGYESLPRSIFDILNGYAGDLDIYDDRNKSFDSWYGIIAPLFDGIGRRDRLSLVDDALVALSSNERALEYMIRCHSQLQESRCLFFSKHGYAGSGTLKSAEGDVISVFPGVALPTILRKSVSSLVDMRL